MTLVIGVCGAKGSGKDQFYRAAKAAFPQLDVRKIAYADPIKHEVCRIFNLKSETEYDMFKRTSLKFTLSDYSKHEVDGRQAVREIGMLMRKYDEQQFVHYVEDTIRANPQALWIVTDLRFDNELQSIKQNLDGVVIKIKRDGCHYDGHITETEFADDQCTSVLHNSNLTLEQYNQLVVAEMNKILQTLALMKERA